MSAPAIDGRYQPILSIHPPSGPLGFWQASLVHYPFGAAGIPDPSPGFRSYGSGDTLEDAIRDLMHDLVLREMGGHGQH